MADLPVVAATVRECQRQGLRVAIDDFGAGHSGLNLLADLQPDLIKLDLQGSELEALRGATECLARAQAVMVEVNFFEFGPRVPLVSDVVGFLKGRGYELYDVLGLWHRPVDGAMAQGDFLFLKADHPLRADRRYDP